MTRFVERRTGEKKKRKDGLRSPLEGGQERNVEAGIGQVTSASVGSCPPADSFKNMGEMFATTESWGEKSKNDGKNKPNKTRGQRNS